MVIDTSALVAILFGEPEADTFATLIEADPVRLMSAASALETSIVIFSELGDAPAQATRREAEPAEPAVFRGA